MEKRTPHCRLSTVKALVAAGRVRTTRSASRGARVLGIEDVAGMSAVVMALVPRDFHKSMKPTPTIESGRTSITPDWPVASRST